MNLFRKKQWFKVSIIMALVAVLIFLSACGAKNDSFEKAESIMEKPGVDLVFNENIDYDAVVVESTSKNKVGSDGSGFTSTATEAESFAFERMMIYRGILRMEVEVLKDTTEQVIQTIQGSKGYLVNSNQTENDVRFYARYEFRVPVKGFHPLIDELKNMSLGKISYEDINGTDVTEEYLDIDSRLNAKRAYEKRLLELFNQATKTEDLLKISNDLSRVQEEIERLLGRQKYLSYNAEYSTLVIEMEQYKNKVAPTATTWEKAVDGFKKSIEYINDLFNTLFIWTFSFAPILILLIIVFIIVWQIVKKRNKNIKRYIPNHQDDDGSSN